MDDALSPGSMVITCTGEVFVSWLAASPTCVPSPSPTNSTVG
jgi:hypothetical protein